MTKISKKEKRRSSEMRPPRSILRPDSESMENSEQNMSPPCSEVPSKESLVWSILQYYYVQKLYVNE